MNKNSKTKTKLSEGIAKTIFMGSAIFSVIGVAAIVLYIFYFSFPAFREIGVFNFLFGTVWAPTKEFLDAGSRFGIFPMIISTLAVTALAVVIGGVVGIFTAVFMAFFCPKRLKGLFSQFINLLAGIPSIVYGFFGLVVIVPLLASVSPNGAGKGLLACGLVLGIMILPTIASITKNSILAIPQSYYEGALALGSTREQAVFKVMIPAAKSGIITGIVLGIGRAVGETMAVMMIAGNSVLFPTGFFSSIRTLTINIVLEMSYSTGLHRQALIATGFVLLVFVLILNFGLSLLKRTGRGRLGKKRAEAVVTENVRWDSSSINTSKGAGVSLSDISQIPTAKVAFIKKGALERTLKYVCFTVAGIVTAALMFIIGFVLVKGIPNISLNLLFGESGNNGMTLLPAFISTGMLILLSLAIALPIGIASAIFLVEYSKKGSRLVKVIRVFTDTLAGIPSIVFGLFGMIVFCDLFGFGYSLLSGSFTLVLIILPTIIRSTEESLLSVSDALREGSLALGAGKVRTIFKVVLPNALSGILTAVVLSIGRIVSESAALIYTAGAVSYAPMGYLDPGASFAVMMWMFAGEGMYLGSAYATAVVLMVVVAALNLIVYFIEKKAMKRNG